MNPNKITFCTGVGTVTGANFLFEAGGKRILVDCGMVQGERVAQQQNYEPFGYEASSIDILMITHAHLDHVGRIPKLVKEGFKGVIYSTPETQELALLVLNDAVNILTMEAEQNGLEPLYTVDDVAQVFPLWKNIAYHEKFELTPGVSVFLKDAGHILGSSMFEFSVKDSNGQGKKILFTGDLGNSPAPLLRDTEPVGDVDYLIMESVYGDRNHNTRENRLEEFTHVITETLARGGTLVIPAFSIDRTQVLLYELNNLVKDKKIPSVPVFLDSPMGEKATAIYRASTEFFNEAAQKQINGGDDVFSFPHLTFVESQRESQGIDHLNGAKIILAGSGMSVGGRVIGHEQHFLTDPKSTILLVGYQASGSLGRELADGGKKVTIHGQKIEVKAHIETLYGYSAHKDGDHLVEFVSTGTNKLKEVFVVMGEPGASMHLAQRLNDELNVKAIVPERMKEYTV
ncbi:MAG: MBL fold metallo-hydrolase [Candidatus Pacebacteria bacterium]|nr:MBL fold metallo-hydrolase [Candidatus Paceibacterota bacterium]